LLSHWRQEAFGLGDIKIQGLLLSLAERFDYETLLKWFPTMAPVNKLGSSDDCSSAAAGYTSYRSPILTYVFSG
jgi:hypothetical protein